MKNKGFTLIEMTVAAAIIGIIFLMTAPLVKSFSMINERVHIQNKVDREFAMVTKFIKKQVRGGKRSDKATGNNNDIDYACVLKSSVKLYKNNKNKFFKANNIANDDETGSVLFIEIPFEESDGSDSSKFGFFIYDRGSKEIRYLEDFNSDSEEVLMENVEDASFQYKGGVVTFSIDLDVGEYEGKIKDSIKDSAVSRINLNI